MMELPFILTLPRLHEVAAPIYLIVLFVEYLLVTRGLARGHFRREDTHTSLIMGIGSVVSGVFISRAALPGLAQRDRFWQWLHVETSHIATWLIALHVALGWRWLWGVTKRLVVRRRARAVA